MKKLDILKDLADWEVLGLTIIGEARGEPVEGQVAVGCVIRNRLHGHPAKYKYYRDVCLEPKQFSCWNDNDPNQDMLLGYANVLASGKALEDIALEQCMHVANGIAAWHIKDNTDGSEHYLTAKLYLSENKPSWANHPVSLPVIHGHQVFFNV